MNPSPIFIVGSPRSGTTLLQQMLNRHPALAICGETHFLNSVYPPRKRQAFGDPADTKNRRRIVDEYLSTLRFQHLGLDAARVSERLMREGTSYRELFRSLLSYYAESQGKARYGEKTPQHAFFTETLCEWFPGAVILHIVRDPRDVVASLQRMPFGFGSAVLNARTWLKSNLAARRSRHRPGYREVRYEVLVAEPERSLNELCAFLGLEFSPAMLNAEDDSVMGRLGKDRFRTRVTTERLGEWRKELSPAQVAQAEWMIGSQLETFGYQPEAPRASAATVLQGLGTAAFALARHGLPRLPALWYYYTAPTDLRRQEYWRHRQLGTAGPVAHAAREESVR